MDIRSTSATLPCTQPFWMASSRSAWAEALAPQLYQELKVLAHAQLRREADGHTLGTTALVHEAWLRISASEALPPEEATQFFAIASTTMRRVLVDHARRIRADKRGSGVVAESLEAVEAFLSTAEADEMLALDDALERLTVANPRAAQVVEMRFFGGLTETETADALAVSPKTVQRDWLAARAWLRKEVSHDLGLPDRA
jgi:RNA polymerase sigma-70 factor, ECF subfamily